MIGVVGLEHHPPGALRPPGAPGHLDDELGHALGGAEVGAIEAIVGIQDADQGDAGEVMALGQHLGAHQQRVFPRPGRRQQPVQFPLAAGAVPVHPGDADVGEQGLEFPLQALRPLPQGADIQPPALGAGRGQGLDQAAVMAPEAMVRQVQGEAGVTVGTAAHPAAVVAGQDRGEATAVEEEQHLIAGGELLAHQPDQDLGQAPAQRLAADVEQADGGMGGAAGPLRELQATIAAQGHVAQALQGGRRRTQYQGATGLLGAAHRQIPSGVAKAVLLLEGEVMLLVHQDESQARQGGEDRGAGP